MSYTNQSQNSASYIDRIKRESATETDYSRTFDEVVLPDGTTFGELTFQELTPASYTNQSQNSALELSLNMSSELSPYITCRSSPAQ